MMNSDLCVTGVAAVLLIVGCGGSRQAAYPVSGKVVFADGKPVTAGYVETRSKDDRINARARIASDGTFQLGTFAADDGAVAGKSQLVVIMVVDNTKDLDDPNGGNASLPPVHARHAKYETSDLEIDVQASGNNEFKIVVDRATRRRAK